jgi:hypothetical protein
MVSVYIFSGPSVGDSPDKVWLMSVPVTLNETSHDIFNPSKEILGEYSNYATTYMHIHSPAAKPVQQTQQVW